MNEKIHIGFYLIRCRYATQCLINYEGSSKIELRRELRTTEALEKRKAKKFALAVPRPSGTEKVHQIPKTRLFYFCIRKTLLASSFL